VVITLALRTPLAKAVKGAFKDTNLDYMLYALLKEVLARSKLDPALIEDVCLGNVSLPFYGCVFLGIGWFAD
jgi:acetyl-CoA acetyltransferase